MNEIEFALIKKCKNGDADAFEKLIGAHEKRIFNLCYRYLSNYDDALELSQEIFVKIYKSINSFNSSSSVYTWIYRIATTTCIDELRKRKKSQTVSIEEARSENNFELHRDNDYDNPYQVLEKKEMRGLIELAISQLDEEFKSVIILRDIQGFSYNEISQILDIPLGTIKSRISRAREYIKDYLINSGNFFNNNSSKYSKEG